MNSHSIKYSIPIIVIPINTYFYRYLYFQQQSPQGEEALNEMRLDERMVEKLLEGEREEREERRESKEKKG